jgi:hypothetical protein
MKIRTLLFFGAHALLGLGISQSRSLTYYWGIAILACGVIDVVFHRNRGNQAALWAAYYAGMEVFLRMTNGMVFWEFGKYGVIVLLVIGILIEFRKVEIPKAYVYYFLLLLPSIVVASYPNSDEGRQQVSFNLSGPLSLAVATIYFYQRSTSIEDIKKIMVAMLLPIAAMAIYLMIITPKTTEIVFTTQSNFRTSGGYGPNQVSTALGVGIMLLGIGLFYRFTITGVPIVDIALMGLLLFRGLVTFSRGGVVSAVLALGVMIVLALFSAKSKVIVYTLFILAIAWGVGYGVWDYANESTGKLLTYRYIGVNPVNNQQEEELTSHRLLIAEKEWEWFRDNPVFGIGPGMGKYYSMSFAKLGANSHSEVTRLFAEHGLFGIASLLILLIFPYRHFRQMKNEAKPMLIAFIVLSILTISHSAMRLAIPGFLYGLSFITPSGSQTRV